MVNILKGDLILNKNTNTEHVVESVEIFNNSIVIFTDDNKCKCFPISEIIKIPKSKLAYYFLKKMNNIILSENEELYVEKKIKELKPISIKPFDYSFFENELPNLIGSTSGQTSIPFFARFCKWIGFTSFQRI